MREIDLRHTYSAAGKEALRARQVRHLEARLRDFGPDGPEVLEADQASGTIFARFPGRSTKMPWSRSNRATTLSVERDHGILVDLEGDRAVFHLSPQVSFEALDYVWGCLFQILE